jgi:hypothetical protein
VSWAFVRAVVRPDPQNPPCSRALYFRIRAWRVCCRVSLW